MSAAAQSDLATRLRDVLERRYHHRHPFNLRMHAGELEREEIQLWVRNRYYYQTRIPIKDGMILAKSGDAAFRREWVGRIHDHDGRRPGEGGLELWLRLGEAVGLERSDLEALDDILPGVRRACDAYVEFVEGHDLLESIAASLTEIGAGEIMKVRIAAFQKHYSWVSEEGLAYFRSRVDQAPRDASYGLTFVCEHARSGEDADRCVAALERKCEILWGLLDAVERGLARPRLAGHAIERREPDGSLLLVLPERALRIEGSGEEILPLLDGSRRAVEVATTLRARHGGRPADWDEVHDFLEHLFRAGALETRGAGA